MTCGSRSLRSERWCRAEINKAQGWTIRAGWTRIRPAPEQLTFCGSDVESVTVLRRAHGVAVSSLASQERSLSEAVEEGARVREVME